jgi:ribosomal protein S18 acetylase RimI-like enzyme
MRNFIYSNDAGLFMAQVIPFPNLRISSFKADNLDEAARLMHDAWHETYSDHLPRDLVSDRTMDYFRRYLLRHNHSCWIAWQGKELAGLVAVTANCIEDLWVAKAYRRRRIGTRLMEAAMTHFVDRGFESAQVGCEGFNRTAIGFFESNGWKKAGSEPVEIAPGSHVDALVYTTSVKPA